MNVPSPAGHPCPPVPCPPALVPRSRRRSRFRTIAASAVLSIPRPAGTMGTVARQRRRPYAEIRRWPDHFVNAGAVLEDIFNPYKAWLSWEQSRGPDYYELLAID